MLLKPPKNPSDWIWTLGGIQADDHSRPYPDVFLYCQSLAANGGLQMVVTGWGAFQIGVEDSRAPWSKKSIGVVGGPRVNPYVFN